MENISIRLEDMIEAIREIAESVEDGSWKGLSQRVEDTLFPKNTPVSEKDSVQGGQFPTPCTCGISNGICGARNHHPNGQSY